MTYQSSSNSAQQPSAEFRMWRHFCSVERVPLDVGAGERCSWCMQAEGKGFGERSLRLVPKAVPH